jgi:hypothetical protein
MVAFGARRPGSSIIDPACGTGGFLRAAHLTTHHTERTREQGEHLRLNALLGVEIVQAVTRLCAMNLLLYNVGPTPQELDKLRAVLVAEGKIPEVADAEVDREVLLMSAALRPEVDDADGFDAVGFDLVEGANVAGF